LFATPASGPKLLRGATLAVAPARLPESGTTSTRPPSWEAEKLPSRVTVGVSAAVLRSRLTDGIDSVALASTRLAPLARVLNALPLTVLRPLASPASTWASASPACAV
jgi:hypothetical protein